MLRKQLLRSAKQEIEIVALRHIVAQLFLSQNMATRCMNVGATKEAR
jgi:hypothetical protein